MKIMRCTPGIKFLRKYLKREGVEYELNVQLGGEYDSISFKKNDIRFDIVADGGYILADAMMPDMIDGNEETLSQVKEYVHRCNMYNPMVWFEFCDLHLPKIHITCGFSKYHSEKDMKNFLIGGINAIEDMMVYFYPGIEDIVNGKGSAKKVFKNRKKEKEKWDLMVKKYSSRSLW